MENKDNVQTEEITENKDVMENENNGDVQETPTESVYIDDSEDDEESLKKSVDKQIEKPPVIFPRWAKILVKVLLAVCGVFIFLFICLFIYAALRPAKPDDKVFVVDDPNDPNSFTNVAIQTDQSILPLIEFSVNGRYIGYDEEDVYTEYRFLFDETGYYEGYSSSDMDDFGKWEINSTGDDYVLEITCTEAHDTYKLSYLENGQLLLDGRDKKFTLSPDK